MSDWKMLAVSVGVLGDVTDKMQLCVQLHRCQTGIVRVGKPECRFPRPVLLSRCSPPKHNRPPAALADFAECQHKEWQPMREM